MSPFILSSGACLLIQKYVEHVWSRYTTASLLYLPFRNPEVAEKVAVILITRGADVNAQDSHYLKRTALHEAALTDCVNLLELLILKGGKLDTLDRQLSSPLGCAIRMGHMETVKLLLAKGAPADPNHHLFNQQLILAIMNDQLTMVKFFLEEYRANCDKLNLAEAKSLEMVRYLHSKGVSLDSRGFGKRALLHITDDLNILEYAITNGADLEIKTSNGNTPLMSAASAGRYEVAKLLLKHGAKVQPVNAFDPKTAPLPVAAENANGLPIVKLLRH
ncbi:Transient receptor putative cation channel sub A member 1 [Rhizophlyctis rosea]|uniref:Transient receptor putative cation channel sub A member 1 n=1 Tax=Rhizophlyctis rosea TaxID=64517 RepID=A0AAD5SFN6_9FUNG|nr:Transient receptor putative cation channel sub A member 1 [Rhizophlyctis rosea]